MWGGPGGGAEEPPGTTGSGVSETVANVEDTCEQNKNQLESFKEIMLRNKQSLKKKEEEVQEYARKLSKIKSRAKLSRRSKDASSSSLEATPEASAQSTTERTPEEGFEDAIDDISHATTPKAKSSLLQRKLAENKKIFEKKNKERSESKRAVEEKVEAIRQQLEERDLTISELQKEPDPGILVTPVLITSQDIHPTLQLGHLQDKDNKIAELGNKILELEATVLDLRENLKEKDSVLDSKTKAITLMSADLSRKGKTTLDTLEDTKDEMRTMQANFVLIETSLKSKNDSLLEQLHERDNRITEFEETLRRLEDQLEKQKVTDSATADFSRSTLDTLAETKDAMKSMQENFILIETSLKAKNDNLLQQLQERESKLAEAEERISKLESGTGISTLPEDGDLQKKLEKLKLANLQLHDEKYELQKAIVELQAKVISNEPVSSNGLIVEKDNRIAELESLIEELRKSNQLLLEESKSELQNQIIDLSTKNEEYSNKISDLEKLVHDLETEKNELMKKIPEEGEESREDAKVTKLSKELDELNKSMIKLKAQHKSKVKSLQKQLESFKKVSDANAELVKLGNQLTLLEEEKGNLQLSLVDFDELKASTGDWQERIADLESKVSGQANEIESQVQAIATLENQKLDLTQELHTVKQEVSALEAENAESENLRVTAEMKIVELEEQLESLHKSLNERKSTESDTDLDKNELLKKIEALTQENNNLVVKLTKLEEKGTSDAGSTESFETLHETDRNELLKKIEILTQENNELVVKLTKLEEKAGSNGGSTESFEALNDTDKNELLKKIDLLAHENNDLLVKLTKLEEKGSSDTGSTESFERIPDDTLSRIETLTQENNDLVIKLIKLEEKLVQIEDNQSTLPDFDKSVTPTANISDLQQQIRALTEENNDLVVELNKFKDNVIQDANFETPVLQKQIEILTSEFNDLVIKHTKLEEKLAASSAGKSEGQSSNDTSELEKKLASLTQEYNDLVIKMTKLEEKTSDHEHEVIVPETVSDNEGLLERINVLTEENNELVIKITKLEEKNEDLKKSLDAIVQEKHELVAKVDQMTTDAFARERLELIEKLENLNREKQTVAQERLELHEEISTLLHKSTEDAAESQNVTATEVAPSGETTVTVASLENEIAESRRLIAEQKELMEEMKIKLAAKEQELELKTREIESYQIAGKNVDALEAELQESLGVIEEWKLKFTEMQKKMDILEVGKASIEEGLNILQAENKHLVEQSELKDVAASKLKQELDETIARFETRLNDEIALVFAKEQEISALKESIANKEEDLHDKYEKLQDEMIMIDSLQDELNKYKHQFQEKEVKIASLGEEIEKLNATSRSSNEEIVLAKNEIQALKDQLHDSKSVEEFNILLGQLNDSQAEIQTLKDRIKSQTNENNKLHHQIENMSLHIQDIQSKLAENENKTAQLMGMKQHLEEKLAEAESANSELNTQLSHLQDTLERNDVYVIELRNELKEEYKKLELLKAKHVEDTGMQSRRLEDLVEDLNMKTQENENLKMELDEKHRLLGQNVTEEIKIALEARVGSLEEKLAESESKAQAQLEKMKKIAANLKKKVGQCQELEAKVSELEEKWTLEKSAKEAMNNKIQETENISKEKDNKIANLEERLLQSENQALAALESVEKLTVEINSSKEKIASLLDQVTDMGEECTRLQAEITKKVVEVESERQEKQDISTQFEAYKHEMEANDERKQQALEEAKEDARELSVRMQVMESEYVEQLSLIQKLMTENGMLSSKETQINEKLENVEKESEERKILLEHLQREKANVIEKVEVQKVQNLESELREETMKASRNSVQALEAKLQERDAVIESLETELGKSNVRVNRLEEALAAVEERRRSLEARAELLGAELEQSFRITEEASLSEDMLEQRLAALIAKDEAIGEKLSETREENNELMEKIKSLQALNVSLQERIAAVEEELAYGREASEKLQSVDVLYSELVQKSALQENELKKRQQELDAAKQHIDNSEREVTVQISQLDSDKKQLLEKCEKLTDVKDNLEQQIDTLKDGVNLCRQRITELETEVESYKQENSRQGEELSKLKEAWPISQASPEETEKLRAAIAEKDLEIENYQRRNMQLQMAAFDSPKPFDASGGFGDPVAPDTSHLDEVRNLKNVLSERQNECAHLSEEIDKLNQQIVDHQIAGEALLFERQALVTQIEEKDQHYSQLSSELQNLQTQYGQLQDELARVQQMLIEKNQQTDALNIELNNVGVQLQAQFNQQGGSQETSANLENIISSKDAEIQTLTNTLSSLKQVIGKLEETEVAKNILLEDKEDEITRLESEKATFATKLNDLKLQQQEAARIVGHIIAVAEERVNNLNESTAEDEMIDEETGLSRIELKLNEILAELDTVKREKDQLLNSQELYRNKIAELEREVNTMDGWGQETVEISPAKELEGQLNEILKEKDALQSQVDDLTQTLVNLRASCEGSVIKSTHAEEQLNEALQERDLLKAQIAELTRAMNDRCDMQLFVDSNLAVSESKNPAPTVSSVTSMEESNEYAGRQPVVEEVIQKSVFVELCDEETTDKLELDEEGWGWNADEAQLEEHHQSAISLVPSAEIQLQTKIAELEDRMRDLEAEKEKVQEENKAAQVRSGKLVRKLKEFKVQNEHLQQQLKQQKLSAGFCDLDSAIEEELKTQIQNLEKALKEAKDEHKKLFSEKENMHKRLDMLTAANERFVEMKEKQDMEVEVWQIRTRELVSKVQALEWQLQKQLTGIGLEDSPEAKSQAGLIPGEAQQSGSEIFKSQSKREQEQSPEADARYKEEIDDLKQELEALAAENEQLQELLEEQKKRKPPTETKLGVDSADGVRIVEQLTQQNTELWSSLENLKEEYNVLRKQYEQSLMAANDQVTAMRRNNDILRTELETKASELENEKQVVLEESNELRMRMNGLQEELQSVSREKTELSDKVKTLETVEDKLTSVSVSLGEVTELLNARVQEVADLRQELQQQYLERKQAESMLHEDVQRLSQERNSKKTEIDNLRQELSRKESELLQQRSVDMVTTIVSQATEELGQQQASNLESMEREVQTLRNIVSDKEEIAEKYNLEQQKNIAELDSLRQEIERQKNMLAEQESVLTSKMQELTDKDSNLERYKAEQQKYTTEHEKSLREIEQLRNFLADKESGIKSYVTDLENQVADVRSKEEEIKNLNTALFQRDSNIEWYNQELQNHFGELQNRQVEIDQLKTESHSKQVEIDQVKMELQSKRAELDQVRLELQEKVEEIDRLRTEYSNEIEHIKHTLIEKEAIIERNSHQLNEKQKEMDRLSSSSSEVQKREVPKVIDSFPVFKMGGGDDLGLPDTVENLKSELQAKQLEIDHLMVALSESTYPKIIQELQNNIDELHVHKAQLEQTMHGLRNELASKQSEIEELTQKLSIQQHETSARGNERAGAHDQKEIARLQNDLHTKEQELNELRYIIEQKESQISLQASFGSQSDDFEREENIQRLNSELYVKEQEIESLKSRIIEKDAEIASMKELGGSLEEERILIQKLTADKEQLKAEAESIMEIKLKEKETMIDSLKEAEGLLKAELKEKETEIDQLKLRLAAVSQELLDSLQLKDKDIENLRRQMEKLGEDYSENLRHKDEELLQVRTDLTAKERSHAELTITKDAEIHNLGVQIRDKDVRIAELLAISDEEEQQLAELRQIVDAKEEEILSLKTQLTQKVAEYEMVERVLKRDIHSAGAASLESMVPGAVLGGTRPDEASEGAQQDAAETSHAEAINMELDLALYMLHQRDVRCEELTLELMQLLEERDTLQLRLSNAIRVNEELRRTNSSSSSPEKNLASTSKEEPIIEQPSPSKSDGPVEIAKEALHSPIGENKDALAQKLSQLHDVGHKRDVRLQDERELRHTQQMSLLAHRDILSNLPPEAAARLVNANYTLSRDVQSQSSVLMNWLWGKSTPKVMHM